MTRRRAGLLHVPSQPILGLPMRAMPLSTGQGLPGQVWACEPSPAHQMLQTVPKYLFWGDLRVGHRQDHNSGDYGQQGVAEAEHAVGVLGPVGSVLVLCARGGVSLHAEGWLWGPGPGHGGAWKAAQV